MEWDTSTIHLQRVVRYKNNQAVVSTTMKSQAENGVVPLWPSMIPYLGEKKDSGYIVQKDGKPLTERQYNIRWNRMQKHLITNGVSKPFTAHRLRHTYATVAANSGDVPTKVLQGLLGHANYQTTMNVYAGFDSEKTLAGGQQIGAKYSEIAEKSCSKNCSA